MHLFRESQLAMGGQAALQRGGSDENNQDRPTSQMTTWHDSCDERRKWGRDRMNTRLASRQTFVLELFML